MSLCWLFILKCVAQEPSPLLMKVADDQSSYMETESVKDTEGDAASEILNDSVEVSTPVPEKPVKKVSSCFVVFRERFCLYACD
jgi:hypothetical protein